MSPRISYNWSNYRVFDCFGEPCPNTRSNLGLGLNVGKNVSNDMSVLTGVNFYTHKVTYNNQNKDGFNNMTTENIQFRHFDIKIGMENSIFGKRTKVGIGLQMEVMYDIKDKRTLNGPLFDFPSKYYYGFECTASHKINKVELFFDAFFNINTARENRLTLLYHTNFQLGVGYQLTVGKSKIMK